MNFEKPCVSQQRCQSYIAHYWEVTRTQVLSKAKGEPYVIHGLYNGLGNRCLVDGWTVYYPSRAEVGIKD
jgi:hypothetical protein